MRGGGGEGGRKEGKPSAGTACYAEAVAKIDAKRIAFGHLWELGHRQGHKGRFDERLVRPRLAEAKAAGCKDVSIAFWGDRIL